MAAMEKFYMPDAVANSSEKRTPARLVWTGGWPQTSREFEALTDMLLDKLVRYAYHRLGTLDEAEDAVQDVLVKAYADRAKLSRVQKVVPYIYRMVTNACLDRRFRHRPGTVSFEELGPNDSAETIPDASNDFVAFEELHRIEQLLSILPADQAEVISMRILDQLSLVEIADITGCNLPTVKSRLKYGLQRLRRKKGSL